MDRTPVLEIPKLELRARRWPVDVPSLKRPNTVEQLIYGVTVVLVIGGLIRLVVDGDESDLKILLVAIVLALVLPLAAGRQRLRVTADSIVRVGMLPARRVARHDVAGVVRVPITTFGEPDGVMDVLVDAEGHALMRFRGRLWEDGDLDRAWAAAGFAVQHAEQPMNLRRLGDWIPGSARSWERDPGGVFVKGLWVACALFVVWVATPL